MRRAREDAARHQFGEILGRGFSAVPFVLTAEATGVLNVTGGGIVVVVR